MKLFRKYKPKTYRHKPTVSQPVKSAIKKAIKHGKEQKSVINVGSETVYQVFNSLNTWEGFGNDPTESLLKIAQGDSDTTRDGDRIKLDNGHLTVDVCLPPNTVTLANADYQSNNFIVRMLVVQAKRSYDATTIIAAFNTLTFGADSIIKGNKDVDDYCNILRDQLFVFRPDAVTYNTTTDVIRRASNIIHKMTIKPKNTSVEWKSTTTTALAPDVKGTIFTMWYCTETDPGAVVQASGPPRYKMAYDMKFREI